MAEAPKIALIGLGAIGVPIADRLYKTYPDSFYLILNGKRRSKWESSETCINSSRFSPKLASLKEEIDGELDLLLVCVKNYDLATALTDIRKVITERTILLPLQNGIYAYEFFKRHFPDHVVLEGYVQGPNTTRDGNQFVYQNSGSMHIGTSNNAWQEAAKSAYQSLRYADIPVTLESNIRHMVWKKWMLNVAGNSVTALTGADYSMFKYYSELRALCIHAMEEFLQVARAEQVSLQESDLQDVMRYYVSYQGSKKTSMLMDVLHHQKTENDYLAGMLLQLAGRHGLRLPIIETLYHLMEAKERVYMEQKGCMTMKNLFREGVVYSDTLRAAMEDIDAKMHSKSYAESVNAGMPEQLKNILTYAIENTEFYANIPKETASLSNFPVMNKTLLNENYDKITVHHYDDKQTHRMYTSGSTGIPFSVIQDLEKRERHIADLKFFGAMAGYLDRDPMCYLRAKPTATPEAQERDNIWQLDICNLSEKNLTDYYHVMVEKKCTALIAYPSTLETAVDFWSKHFTNDSCIQTIISTSETLTDAVKEKLRAFFGQNVGVYARYSNTENGILGQETGVSGEYHLNWASYYFEILKLDSDTPAEDGELGRIVVTDLYNKAFPMIRYDTGDVARMQRNGNDVLPVFTELYGRRMDLIYDTKGEVVSPFLLCRTMRLSHGIEQWQFIQETETTYTLRITANTDERPSCEAEIMSFQKTLGPDAKIQIEYVEHIPVMNSLKRKLIVSNLKK